MNIAFASTGCATIDLRFGETDIFKIWEIAPDRADYHGERSAVTSNLFEEERDRALASAVADCSIVCSMDIDTVALARIAERNAFHLKTETKIPISEIVEKIENLLPGNPPPWMKKAMGMHLEPVKSACPA